MRTAILLFLFSVLCMSSCKKVDCDATLCVKNTGSQVIHYAWGSNFYTDSIMPGESACENVGHIEITSTTESTITAYFNSDHGDYAILVDECDENHEIQ